jgi:type I restriction enzyme S subunit
MTEQKSLKNVDSEEKNSEETIGKVQEEEESHIEGWKLQKLGDILIFEYGNNLPEDDRNEGNIPVYGSNGQVDTHDEVYVDGEGIVVGRKGSIAEAEYSEQPFFPIDTTYYISEEETDERLRFLYYLINHLQLDRLNAASAIPGLNRNDAYNVKALIPPKEEQEKIASVLYNVDQAIQKTEEIIEQTQRVKKGLIQDLISSEYADKTQKIRLGPQEIEIPGNWQVKTLQELCNKVTDGTHDTPKVLDEGYPFITSEDTINQTVNFDNGKYISEEEHQKIMNRSKPEKGDILFTHIGANTGNVAQVEVDFEFSIKNVALFKPDNQKILSDYLTHYLRSFYVRKFIDRMTQGSGQEFLSLTELNEMPILLPPIEEQERISEIIGKLENKVENEESSLKQLQRIKKGLMQDLLTGEIRTHDKKIEVLEEVKA